MCTAVFFGSCAFARLELLLGAFLQHWLPSLKNENATIFVLDWFHSGNFNNPHTFKIISYLRVLCLLLLSSCDVSQKQNYARHYIPKTPQRHHTEDQAWTLSPGGLETVCEEGSEVPPEEMATSPNMHLSTCLPTYLPTCLPI